MNENQQDYMWQKPQRNTIWKAICSGSVAACDRILEDNFRALCSRTHFTLVLTYPTPITRQAKWKIATLFLKNNIRKNKIKNKWINNNF